MQLGGVDVDVNGSNSLRHATATFLVQNGVPVAAVCARAGWRSYNTFLRYYNVQLKDSDWSKLVLKASGLDLAKLQEMWDGPSPVARSDQSPPGGILGPFPQGESVGASVQACHPLGSAVCTGDAAAPSHQSRPPQHATHQFSNALGVVTDGAAASPVHIPKIFGNALRGSPLPWFSACDGKMI